jgi:ketosteroid isomerase-like protein
MSAHHPAGIVETPDQLAISVAKTEYREGYNSADINRVLAVFAPSFFDLSDGQPTSGGAEAHDALRRRLEDLFSHYSVRMTMMIIDIVIAGDTAHDFGWHKLWLTPKTGGETLFYKQRYFGQWKKQADGAWKIVLFMSNREGPPRLEPVSEAGLLKAAAAQD